MNRIILLIISYLVVHQIAFTQSPANNDPHWQLNWEDNFNFLNTNIWKMGDYGIHDKEPQLYLSNQVRTENGYLVIEINNNAITCPTPVPPTNWVCDTCISGKTYNYRSGVIVTNQPYNTQFGYIEAKIKFPYRKDWSFFPAFWVYLGWDIPKTKNYAEIDICEIFGSRHLDDTYNKGIFREYGDEALGIKPDSWGSVQTFSNFSYTDWHTYAIEWNKDRIIWYLDGGAINSLSNHGIVDPVRIILNLAVQNHEGHLPSTTSPFEYFMYVDYVKVYGLKCDKNTVINEISNFNNYDYAVKKSITMSGATTIPTNSKITLRANDFIELKPGFYAPLGANLYLDVSPCETLLPKCTIQNVIYTNNSAVKNCDNIDVKDVKVKNNAKLELDANEKVTIDGDFEIEAGSELEIK